MNANRTLLVIDSGSFCPCISFSLGFGSKRSIWLGAPSGRKKMQLFAFGAKWGERGESGSFKRADDESAASRPSRCKSEARASIPIPDALDVKNCRRASARL